MTLMQQYTEGEGASHALVGDLATQLALAVSEPAFSGDNWLVTRTGAIVDARNMGDRPFRRMGRHTTFEPESFADVVARYATAATTVWGDRAESNLVAIFNDHPATSFSGGHASPDGAVDPLSADATTLAGHGDHSAILQLTLHPDWVQWYRLDGQMKSQRDFGEHIEDMAHTMITPDAATMLEIATTLTMKSVIDGSSKVRLDNGDVEFKFTQESNMKAGRGPESVAIPSTFTFAVPIWEGTESVEFEARLRVRPLQQHDGVQMGYRLMRRADVERDAFEQVIADIAGSIPAFVPVYRGRATR